MDFYQDSFQLFDGAIVVFRRGDSRRSGEQRVWTARFRFEERQGYLQRSLGTKDKLTAKEKARKLYFEIQGKLLKGESLRATTFQAAWQRWFDEMRQHGSWRSERERWHKGYFNRYFSKYFGSKPLAEVTQQFANGYWLWRANYWSSEEGQQKIEYNRARAGRKTSTTHNAAIRPAPKTLQMECAALNQVFNWCFEHRLMDRPIKLRTPPTPSDREGRRPDFNSHEWQCLVANLPNWAQGKGRFKDDYLNAFHKHMRHQLWLYVLILGSTGLRPGTETRQMRWEDVEWIDLEDTQYLRIRVRRAKKPNGRIVISMPLATKWMRMWKETTHHSAAQDLVWCGPPKADGDQRPIGDLNKSFQSFLRRVPYRNRPNGLLCNGEGQPRTLYSIRHYYASDRLRNGISYEDLSRNMGTGIAQLKNHYDHVTPDDRIPALTKTGYKTKDGKLRSLLKQYDPDKIAKLAEIHLEITSKKR